MLENTLWIMVYIIILFIINFEFNTDSKSQNRIKIHDLYIQKSKLKITWLVNIQWMINI